MRISLARLVGIATLLVTVAGLVWWVLPRPVSVEAAAVTRGRFVATVDEDGKTRIRERYVVAAPLAGLLARVRLKVGDRIDADEPIAAISPALAPFLDPRSRREAEERLGAADAAVERATAAVERARVQAEQARKELDRTRALAERGATTIQARERAELAVHVADRDLRAAEREHHAAEHQLAQAGALLARYQGSAREPPEAWNVTSPVAGVVLKVTQESETIVQPGTVILELGDPRDLEIVVDVLSADAVEIESGAAVAIENWGGAGTLRGQVRLVEPAAFTKISTLGVEEQRVNVLVDLVSPPADWAGLGDGYRVDARITVFAREEAAIVPAGALFRREDGWHVFVVENGRALDRGIVLLRRSGRFAAIAGGLAPGERVIVYPSDRVAAGTRVQTR